MRLNSIACELLGNETTRVNLLLDEQKREISIRADNNGEYAATPDGTGGLRISVHQIGEMVELKTGFEYRVKKTPEGVRFRI